MSNDEEFSDKFLGVIKAKGSLTHEEADKRNNYLVEALFESLTRYLGDDFILHLSKATLLDKTTKSIINKGYDLPLYLMAQIVDYYKDRVTEFNHLVIAQQILDNKAKVDSHLKLLEQYNDNSEQIIEVIDNLINYSKNLPTKLLEQIINSSLEMVKISESRVVAKHVLAIFEHLFTHQIPFPEDILYHFSKVLVSEDMHLQRLALKFYKHLSNTYKVNDIDPLLQVEGDINNKLDICRSQDLIL